MSEEKDTLDDNQDVLDDNKDLDEILDEKKDDVDEKDEKKSENKKEENKKEEGEFNKKLGNQTFTSEKEYDEAVQKMHGRNAQFAGKLTELGYDPKTLTKKQQKEIIDAEEKKDKKGEPARKSFDKKDYNDFKAMDFQENFPESLAHKTVISELVKNDNCQINGKPSYAVAYARVLKGNGQEIPARLRNAILSERGISTQEAEKKSPNTTIKKIYQSGQKPVGSVQETYKNKEELESVSDFANSL